MKSYLAVQYVRVTITLDGHLDVSGITGRDLGLRHQESRSNFALEQWIKPLPLLLLIAVFGKNFHVASIWSSAVASLSCCQHRFNAVGITPFSSETKITVLRTSEAVLLLPRYSAMSPYSKLLNPAPSLKCALGRNMFQRPRACAFFFRSSIIDGCEVNRCCVVSPIWRKYTASAGIHSSSTNFST